MDKAFALAANEPPSERDSDLRHVTFATWDEQRASVDDGLAALRREHLKKYVTATMGASVLILVVAMLRLAIGGSAADEEVARATFAKMRDVPTEIAAIPRQISTLTARTQAALRIEKRRESMKQTTARASRFW